MLAGMSLPVTCKEPGTNLRNTCVMQDRDQFFADLGSVSEIIGKS